MRMLEILPVHLSRVRKSVPEYVTASPGLSVLFLCTTWLASGSCGHACHEYDQGTHVSTLVKLAPMCAV